jgi:hypothetical protein
MTVVPRARGRRPQTFTKAGVPIGPVTLLQTRAFLRNALVDAA